MRRGIVSAKAWSGTQSKSNKIHAVVNASQARRGQELGRITNLPHLPGSCGTSTSSAKAAEEPLRSGEAGPSNSDAAMPMLLLTLEGRRMVRGATVFLRCPLRSHNGNILMRSSSSSSSSASSRAEDRAEAQDAAPNDGRRLALPTGAATEPKDVAVPGRLKRINGPSSASDAGGDAGALSRVTMSVMQSAVTARRGAPGVLSGGVRVRMALLGMFAGSPRTETAPVGVERDESISPEATRNSSLWGSAATTCDEAQLLPA
mmetsp:Transcript_67837/g.196232  ORF Transcript_67837/g.196232 Transcript_67837/m.196232 type:complete len:261 (-) Transcript_67837:354-1136(-)